MLKLKLSNVTIAASNLHDFANFHCKSTIFLSYLHAFWSFFSELPKYVKRSF
jgi:hypothetical protein